MTMWTNPLNYLKVIDRFNALQVSAYVTPGGAALLLLHSGRAEEAVRLFFVEAHEMYVKYLMNPLVEYNEPITSPLFDTNIRLIAKKYL